MARKESFLVVLVVVACAGLVVVEEAGAVHDEGENIFVMIASNTSVDGEQMAWSEDGLTWTPIEITVPAAAQSWQSIAYAQPIDQFMAAKTAGTTGDVIRHETNHTGTTWQWGAPTIADDNGFNNFGWDVEWLDSCRRFLATDRNSGGIARSGVDDPVNWTVETIRTAPSDIAHDNENNITVVAASADGSPTVAYKSEDCGATWQDTVGSPSGYFWSGAAFSPELGQFVLSSVGGGEADRVLQSTDGESWTARTTGAGTTGSYWGVMWAGPPAERFVAFGSGVGGSGHTVFSDDAISWFGHEVLDNSSPIRGMAYKPSINRLVAVGQDGLIRISDNNAVDWVGGATGAPPILWRAIVFVEFDPEVPEPEPEPEPPAPPPVYNPILGTGDSGTIVNATGLSEPAIQAGTGFLVVMFMMLLGAKFGLPGALAAAAVGVVGAFALDLFPLWVPIFLLVVGVALVMMTGMWGRR